MYANDNIQHLIYTASSDVYSQSLAGEAVLLDVATGIYWGLDDVGTRIWELLGQRQTVESIAAVLAEEFQADRAMLEGDTAVFVRALAAKGLVRTLDGAPESEPE